MEYPDIKKSHKRTHGLRKTEGSEDRSKLLKVPFFPSTNAQLFGKFF